MWAMSTPPPLDLYLDRVVIPKTTFLGVIMRISNKARMCGSTPRIDCDPRTWIELRKLLAEEYGCPHDMLLLPSPPHTPSMFMLDGVEFRIRKPTQPEKPCT